MNRGFPFRGTVVSGATQQPYKLAPGPYPPAAVQAAQAVVDYVLAHDCDGSAALAQLVRTFRQEAGGVGTSDQYDPVVRAAIESVLGGYAPQACVYPGRVYPANPIYSPVFDRSLPEMQPVATTLGPRGTTRGALSFGAPPFRGTVVSGATQQPYKLAPGMAPVAPVAPGATPGGDPTLMTQAAASLFATAEQAYLQLVNVDGGAPKSRLWFSQSDPGVGGAVTQYLADDQFAPARDYQVKMYSAMAGFLAACKKASDAVSTIAALNPNANAYLTGSAQLLILATQEAHSVTSMPLPDRAAGTVGPWTNAATNATGAMAEMTTYPDANWLQQSYAAWQTTKTAVEQAKTALGMPAPVAAPPPVALHPAGGYTRPISVLQRQLGPGPMPRYTTYGAPMNPRQSQSLAQIHMLSRRAPTRGLGAGSALNQDAQAVVDEINANGCGSAALPGLVLAFQQEAGSVGIDGQYGPETQAAIASILGSAPAPCVQGSPPDLLAAAQAALNALGSINDVCVLGSATTPVHNFKVAWNASSNTPKLPYNGAYDAACASALAIALGGGGSPSPCGSPPPPPPPPPLPTVTCADGSVHPAGFVCPVGPTPPPGPPAPATASSGGIIALAVAAALLLGGGVAYAAKKGKKKRRAR